MGILKYFMKQKEDKLLINNKEDIQIRKTISYIIEKEFQVCREDYEKYVEGEGIYVLERMREVIEYWEENDKGIFAKGYLFDNNIEGRDVKQAIEEAVDRLLVIETSIKQLRQEEKELRTAIINFTNIINEVSNKFKLSPTWEGRKPLLLEKRKELEVLKSAYEEKEDEINALIREYRNKYRIAFEEVQKACLLYIEKTG